ncbi:MAG: ribosome biogenesis GTPase YlqF [Oscillospiraceae bacterium]|nr:ribosome biogenesis GTPase YlqF [Oscillospiraceae bacterium]
MNIQWFPGHMTKARRMMQESLGMVDALCEILDARIPAASRNPEIDAMAQGKPRLIILNRADLADPVRTEQWKEYYKALGFSVMDCDARSGKRTAAFSSAVRTLLADRLQAWEEKGQIGRKLRVMIAGIPNVGKSTFINSVAGRRAAAAGDKPGVTRGRQWIAVDDRLELLDTPGILWPKFEDPQVGELLAVTNAIKAEVVDRETLAANFMLRLRDLYPDALKERYKLEPDPTLNGYELLEEAGKKRGMRISGGDVDLERMANTLLTEYHSGKLGRLTLEIAPGGE